jgi:hypothetical protein
MELKEDETLDEEMDVDDDEVVVDTAVPTVDIDIPVVDVNGSRQTNGHSHHQFDSLIEKLESCSSSGQKLCKLVVRNIKEVCQLAIEQPKYAILIEKGVKAFSRKCISSSIKCDKFIEKFEHSFTCEGDLFKTILKTGMKEAGNGEGGSGLVAVLGGILSIPASQGKIVNPILGIQMILSHSRAVEIFLENITGKGKPKPKEIKREEEDEMESSTETTKKFPNKKAESLMKFTKIKTELLKLWFVLVDSFTKISKLTGTENDKKILQNSVTYLMQMYNGTLGPSDRQIFLILKLYVSKKLRIATESLPPRANPLYAHSIRANTVLGLIVDTKAFETAMKVKEEELFQDDEDLGEDVIIDSEQFYDLRFLLPLVCHCLDEKNICDVVKVITNGWIHLIMRGLSLKDSVLRNISFLAFKRLIFNLHLAKVQ